MDLADHVALRSLLRIENVKQAVLLEARMKLQAQQAFLGFLMRAAVEDVEKQFRFGTVPVLRQDPDTAVLLDEKLALRAVRRFGHPERQREFQIRIRDLEFNRRDRRS